MYIAYYDESGDDGYPEYSSPLFILTAIYMHHMDWKQNYDDIHSFRQNLRTLHGMPVKLELHTKQLLLNKNPYKSFGWSDTKRVALTELFCDLISTLHVSIVNSVINKKAIRSTSYEVLNHALTYSVQRIENDMQSSPQNRFLMIVDSGRVGKMRKTTRKIQKINFIPSKFGPRSYRKEIKTLVEDPLPKDSNESYFIQMADLVTYLIHLYLTDR